MNSENKYFDESWDWLAELHSIINTPNGPMLDLSRKPKVSARDWPMYIHALQNIIVIGNRNKLISQHVDGRGLGVFILYNNK